MDRRLVDIDRRLNNIDARFDTLEEDIDARFDSVDDSLGELLDLIYSTMYGGGEREDQSTLWDEDSDEREDNDESKEA